MCVRQAPEAATLPLGAGRLVEVALLCLAFSNRAGARHAFCNCSQHRFRGVPPNRLTGQSSAGGPNEFVAPSRQSCFYLSVALIASPGPLRWNDGLGGFSAVNQTPGLSRLCVPFEFCPFPRPRK